MTLTPKASFDYIKVDLVCEFTGTVKIGDSINSAHADIEVGILTHKTVSSTRIRCDLNAYIHT